MKKNTKAMPRNTTGNNCNNCNNQTNQPGNNPVAPLRSKNFTRVRAREMLMGTTRFNCKNCGKGIVITPQQDFVTCTCGEEYHWIDIPDYSLDFCIKKDAEDAAMREALRAAYEAIKGLMFGEDTYFFEECKRHAHKNGFTSIPILRKISEAMKPEAGREMLERANYLEEQNKEFVRAIDNMRTIADSIHLMVNCFASGQKYGRVHGQES